MAVEAPALESPVETPAEVAPADQVVVRVDELIVGRPLEHPINDVHGVLLLAAGKTVTSDFKRLLRQHVVESVQVHNTDARRLRMRTGVPSVKAGRALDSPVAAKLDGVIDSGVMLVQNRGPAAKEKVVRHGRASYNAERRDSLAGHRAAAGASLADAMQAVVCGNSVSGAVIGEMAAQSLSDLTRDVDCTLSVALDSLGDPALSDHCLKMALLGMAIGVELGLDEDNCKRICMAGLIHDWGMAKVPAELRNAPRVLTEHEFFQIRKHPIYAAEMLEHLPGISSTVPIVVYQVHERPNGTGYPRGRVGDRIHQFARILAVADMYTSLTEERPYRQALAPYAAMECLIRLAKTRDVDPSAVRALLHVLTLFPIGSLVTLDDGSIARVLRRNGEQYTTPIIQVVQDADGDSVPPDGDDAVIDLADSPRSVVQALPTPGRPETLLSDGVLFPVRPKV